MASNYPYKRKRGTGEDGIECEICCTRYDGKNCRPKNLPCGHTFCNNCMAKEIGAGRYNCATCRRPHQARYVADLPQNVELERLIRYKKCEEEACDEDETTGGPCPKHKHTLVYFYCHTHSLNVCRECTVIDHPNTQCNLISFKEGIEKKKEDNICKATSTFTSIKTTVSALSEFVKETKKNIANKERMLEQWRISINDTTKSLCEEKEGCLKAHDEIAKGTTKLRELEIVKRYLQNSNTQKTAAKFNNDFTSVTKSITNWIEDVSKEFDFVQKVTFDENSPSPANILKAIMNGTSIYAETTFNGRKGFAKFTSKEEKLHLHPFNFVTSQEGTTVVEYEKVQSYFPRPPTLLFLDLVYKNENKSLDLVHKHENNGRVYIKLKPEIHTFIKNIPAMIIGEHESTIIGNSCIRKAGTYNLGINIENSVNDIDPSKIGPVVIGNGDVVCNFQGNSILHMYLYFQKGRPYPPGYAKIGSIESGIEIVKACRALGKDLQENITISDCGLVLDT